jgi:hypothetical protein
MNNVVFREISTVINRRYRALIWSSKEIKTIDLDLQLVNKISRNILSFIERSLGNSRDNLDVFEPYRVIKTINVNTNLNFFLQQTFQLKYLLKKKDLERLSSAHRSIIITVAISRES